MKTVAIVGGGPTRKQAPWSDLNIDIWQMNEAASKSGSRVDCVFQMHEPGIYQVPRNTTDPKHWDWLKEYHPNLTIYMQKEDPEVPCSNEYPLQEALALTKHVLQKGKSDRELHPIEFFTFTGSYMIALAILQHYDRIKLYGVDMIHTEEYRYQRESFVYWVGFAGGRGIDLEIFGAESMFTKPLYGFQTFLEYKTVKLSIMERINLLENVLPKKGDLITMRVVKDMDQLIGLSMDEIDKYKIAVLQPGEQYPYNDAGEEVGGFVNSTPFPQYRWLPAGNEHLIDVEIGEATRKVIQASYKPLSEGGNITRDLLDLYEKFGYE